MPDPDPSEMDDDPRYDKVLFLKILLPSSYSPVTNLKSSSINSTASLEVLAMFRMNPSF